MLRAIFNLKHRKYALSRPKETVSPFDDNPEQSWIDFCESNRPPQNPEKRSTLSAVTVTKEAIGSGDRPSLKECSRCSVGGVGSTHSQLRVTVSITWPTTPTHSLHEDNFLTVVGCFFRPSNTPVLVSASKRLLFFSGPTVTPYRRVCTVQQGVACFATTVRLRWRPQAYATESYEELRLEYYLPVLSACPLYTNSGCGKKRRILIGPW